MDSYDCSSEETSSTPNVGNLVNMEQAESNESVPIGNDIEQSNQVGIYTFL